jgi:hypothetical protein
VGRREGAAKSKVNLQLLLILLLLLLVLLVLLLLLLILLVLLVLLLLLLVLLLVMLCEGFMWEITRLFMVPSCFFLRGSSFVVIFYICQRSFLQGLELSLLLLLLLLLSWRMCRCCWCFVGH